jgi:hypothetical protein
MENIEESKFEIGDIVKLSSGEGPSLVVLDPDTEDCSLVTVNYWSDLKGRFVTVGLNSWVLTLVEHGEGFNESNK